MNITEIKIKGRVLSGVLRNQIPRPEMETPKDVPGMAEFYKDWPVKNLSGECSLPFSDNLGDNRRPRRLMGYGDLQMVE